ncbi:Cytidine deaminase, homodimeric [Trema orientale]|uniref:cytidine deaminase n=1 Tax=Trema orientale TaxID=63057 RepID=A0A2P5EIK0_TREOI|nr:Cytidine deaminase, homodimeric [Trema orientale]
MDRPRFVIEASEAEAMAAKFGLTVLQLLPSLVKPAQTLARPPISKFPVGAVGYGSSGRIFIGVNLEFPGLPLHHSVHAEQFLVTNLSINGETHLEYIAVSSAPCGHCRQFLQEIRGAPDIKILITSADPGDDESGAESTRPEYDHFNPLLQLLPQRFGPDDLLGKDVPLLLEPHRNGLSLPSETQNQSLSNGSSDENGKVGRLTRAALEAANKSHAPYSGCPSGVAILDSEGKIYKGSYMESAAYNPSLGPVQAALVAYIAGGGGGYDKIVAAVLVEKEGALIRQEQTARLLLQSISPRSEFRAFHCESGSKKACPC